MDHTWHPLLTVEVSASPVRVRKEAGTMKERWKSDGKGGNKKNGDKKKKKKKKKKRRGRVTDPCAVPAPVLAAKASAAFAKTQPAVRSASPFAPLSPSSPSVASVSCRSSPLSPSFVRYRAAAAAAAVEIDPRLPIAWSSVDENYVNKTLCGKRSSPEMSSPRNLPPAWGREGSPLGNELLKKSLNLSTSMPLLFQPDHWGDHMTKSPRKAYYSLDEDDKNSKQRASPHSNALSSPSSSSLSTKPIQLFMPKHDPRQSLSPRPANTRAPTVSRPKSRRGGTRPSTADNFESHQSQSQRLQPNAKINDFMIDPRIPPATAWDWSK